MAGVEAIALDNFVHDDIKAVGGRLVRHSDGSLISEHLARQLEKNRLVRIRMAKPITVRRMIPQAAGKVQDDGPGRPSSASQAAPVSPTPTSTPFGNGAMVTRKGSGASRS